MPCSRSKFLVLIKTINTFNNKKTNTYKIIIGWCDAIFLLEYVP